MSTFYAAVSLLGFVEGGSSVADFVGFVALHSLFAIFGGIKMEMRRSKIGILYDVGVVNTYAR